jgi:Common central domain of tyrosinase
MCSVDGVEVNDLCSNPRPENDNGVVRIRREWTDGLSDYERALYLDAVETAIERGLHQRFVQWHADQNTHVYAHETCGFFLWHRRFTHAYETMLRSLGPSRFRDLTIPYWNVIRDYQLQEDGTYRCRQYGTCSPIVYDLGGKPTSAFLDDWEYRTVADVRELGWIHDKSPLQNFYDDRWDPGIVRFDMSIERIPADVSLPELAKLYNTTLGDVDLEGDDHDSESQEQRQQEQFLSATLKFWRSYQLGAHDRVHDTVGGFMRSRASPVDPLFFPWHATMDLLGYFWELCHEETVTTIEKYPIENNVCLFTPNAKEKFVNFTMDQEWYMTDDDDEKSWSGSIMDDPLIGRYFVDVNTTTHNWWLLDQNQPRLGYIYNDDSLPELQELLKNNPALCPSGLRGLGYYDDAIQTQNRNRTMPSFTKEEIITFKQDWMERATAFWKDTMSVVADVAGNSHQVDRFTVYLECILDHMDHDTLERWAIDDAFVLQIQDTNRTIYHPSCPHPLDDYIGTVSPTGETASTDKPIDIISSSGSSTIVPRWKDDLQPTIFPFLLTLWMLAHHLMPSRT